MKPGDEIIKEVEDWKIVERDNGGSIWFILYRPNDIPEYQSKNLEKVEEVLNTMLK